MIKWPHLAGIGLGHVEGLGELGKVVVDGGLLEAAAIGGQALVQGDGVAFGVLPVGDAGRDLPVLLLAHAHCTRRRVHHRHRRRPRPPWHLQL